MNPSASAVTIFDVSTSPHPVQSKRSTTLTSSFGVFYLTKDRKKNVKNHFLYYKKKILKNDKSIFFLNNKT